MLPVMLILPDDAVVVVGMLEVYFGLVLIEMFCVVMMHHPSHHCRLPRRRHRVA